MLSDGTGKAYMMSFRSPRLKGVVSSVLRADLTGCAQAMDGALPLRQDIYIWFPRDVLLCASTDMYSLFSPSMQSNSSTELLVMINFRAGLEDFDRSDQR